MALLRNHLLAFFVGLTLFLSSIPVSAAQSDAVIQGNFFQNLGDSAKEVASRVSRVSSSTLLGTAKGYASGLIGTGLSIGGALCLIYLCWKVMEHLASGGRGSPPLQILLDVAVPACLAGMFISNYGSYISSLSSLLDAIRNVAGGTDGLLSNLCSMYQSIFEIVSQAFEDAFEALSEAPNPMTGDFWLALGDLLMTGIFSIVVCFIAMIGLAEVAGLILMGPFLFAVGVAFGPVFVAGLVTPWTREYTTKWLGFLVSAATLSGVLSVIVALATSVMRTVDVSGAAKAGGGGSAVQMCIACILLLAINSLIAQAPAVASALVPGSIGARSGAGGAVAGAAGLAAGIGLGAVSKTAGANQARWNRRYEKSKREDWNKKNGK